MNRKLVLGSLLGAAYAVGIALVTTQPWFNSLVLWACEPRTWHPLVVYPLGGLLAIPALLVDRKGSAL